MGKYRDHGNENPYQALALLTEDNCENPQSDWGLKLGPSESESRVGGASELKMCDLENETETPRDGMRQRRKPSPPKWESD